MTLSPRFSRLAALMILIGAVGVAGLLASDWIDAYAEGQRAIAEKRDELQTLQDLVQARTDFARLVPKAPKASLILRTAEGAQEALAAEITQAAGHPQIILDGIGPLPAARPTMVEATVRLRGTQSGITAFLQTVEGATPYLLVPRFALSLARPADPQGSKPLILSADMRIAAPVAPEPPVRRPAATPSAGP